MEMISDLFLIALKKLVHNVKMLNGKILRYGVSKMVVDSFGGILIMEVKKTLLDCPEKL